MNDLHELNAAAYCDPRLDLPRLNPPRLCRACGANLADSPNTAFCNRACQQAHAATIGRRPSGAIVARLQKRDDQDFGLGRYTW